jgi:hypothetical protein
VTLLLALLLSQASVQSAFGPFDSASAPVTAEAEVEVEPPPAERPTGNPLYFAFDVYRLTITVFDGPRCEHRPTCSVYAVRAVQRDGLLGIFLAIDRLWREGESSSLRDPLEVSDFWLRAK